MPALMQRQGGADEHGEVDAATEGVVRDGVDERRAAGLVERRRHVEGAGDRARGRRAGRRALRPLRAGAISAAVARRGDAAEHGDAEGGAELAGGVVHGRARAGPAGGHGRHDRRRHRRHGQRDARRRAGRSTARMYQYGVSAPSRRSSSRPVARQSMPKATVRWAPKRALSRGVSGRHDDHDQRHRQEAGGGRQRAVAEHQLEVLGDQEHHAVHRQEHEDHAAGAGAERRVPEEAHVEHRLVDVQLPEHEDGEHDGGDREGDEGAGRSPSPCRAPR